MARPVNAEADATRARIRDAALELLAERGKTGISVREVSQRADVSVSLIHHYFDNKEGLFVACIDTMYEELEAVRDEAFACLGRCAEPIEFIEAMVRTGFDFACARRPLMKLIVSLLLQRGELTDVGKGRVQEPWLDGWSMALAGHLGCDATEARLTLQSIVFLVSRYSIASNEELRPIVGLGPDASPERLRSAVRDHLASIGRALLAALERRSAS